MTTQFDSKRRNRILDDLQTALDEWADKEEKKTQNEIDFMKSVLRGRTGSERLAKSNIQEAAILVIDDIQSFLTGDGS